MVKWPMRWSKSWSHGCYGRGLRVMRATFGNVPMWQLCNPEPRGGGRFIFVDIMLWWQQYSPNTLNFLGLFNIFPIQHPYKWGKTSNSTTRSSWRVGYLLTSTSCTPTSHSHFSVVICCWVVEIGNINLLSQFWFVTSCCW